MNASRPTRRQMLALSGAAALGALTTGCSERPDRPRKPGTTAPASGSQRYQGPAPTNIILLVSDGMSAGVPTLAEPFSRLTRGADRPTRWHQLMQDPDAVHGLLATESATSYVTDSAAASSAWGSGRKAANGTLNIDPVSGDSLTPLMATLHDVGKRTGLVTTDRITGGTPAGFAVANPSRHAYLEIAQAYLDRVDVLLGGGREDFDPLMRTDRRDVIGRYEKAGYQFTDHRRQVLTDRPTDRVLGLFADKLLPYSIDHANDTDLAHRVPTLAEMTRFALEALSGSINGFFLMVEAARVDHAAHANDAAGILWDQLAFDDAVAEALDFADTSPDTLVIVTSDHGNANPGLNGWGDAYNDSDELFAKLAKFDASFSKMAQLAQDDPDAAVDIVRTHTGLDIIPPDAKNIQKILTELSRFDDLYVQDRTWVAALGQILANYMGVAFTGTTHTADHVILTARGPGAMNFTGLRHHTDVYHRFLEMWALTDPNAAPEKSPAPAPAAAT